MATFPVHAYRDPYHGVNERRRRNARRQNAIAAEIERYINDRMTQSGDEVHVFMYGYIAIDLGIPEETVRRALNLAGGGHNGITVNRPKPRVHI